MSDYFLGLALSCFIGLIIGIIRPKLIGNKSRLFYIVFFIVLFILSITMFGFTLTDTTNSLAGLIGMASIPLFIIVKNAKSKIKSNNKSMPLVKNSDDMPIPIKIPITKTSSNKEVINENYVSNLKSNLHINKSNNSLVPADKIIKDLVSNYPTPLREPGTFNWNIMISFGKSTSQNYDKAVYLAKNSNKYGEQIENEIITHTATFSDSREDFLDFIVLYDIVSDWKSTVFVVNGEIVDKKTVGKLKYCYGDKCRSVKEDFCFGASYMTANPFGCHRLQVSATNNPWWGYYIQEDNHYRFDVDKLIERVKRTEAAFKYCPAFDVNYVREVAMQFPLIITKKQYSYIIENVNRIYIEY